MIATTMTGIDKPIGCAQKNLSIQLLEVVSNRMNRAKTIPIAVTIERPYCSLSHSILSESPNILKMTNTVGYTRTIRSPTTDNVRSKCLLSIGRTSNPRSTTAATIVTVSREPIALFLIMFSNDWVNVRSGFSGRCSAVSLLWVVFGFEMNSSPGYGSDLL